MNYRPNGANVGSSPGDVQRAARHEDNDQSSFEEQNKRESSASDFPSKEKGLGLARRILSFQEQDIISSYTFTARKHDVESGAPNILSLGKGDRSLRRIHFVSSGNKARTMYTTSNTRYVINSDAKETPALVKSGKPTRRMTGETPWKTKNEHLVRSTKSNGVADAADFLLHHAEGNPWRRISPRNEQDEKIAYFPFLDKCNSLAARRVVLARHNPSDPTRKANDERKQDANNYSYSYTVYCILGAGASSFLSQVVVDVMARRFTYSQKEERNNKKHIISRFN
jgi:hypothetical protein